MSAHMRVGRYKHCNILCQRISICLAYSVIWSKWFIFCCKQDTTMKIPNYNMSLFKINTTTYVSCHATIYTRTCVMYNALCKYKNTEGNCFLNTIHRNNFWYYWYYFLSSIRTKTTGGATYGPPLTIRLWLSVSRTNGLYIYIWCHADIFM